jgi:broad specificity phosphatase PhoE
MKLYFVRHGESQANNKGLMTGQMDVSLTEEGMKQAELTEQMLPKDFNLIFCSDLIRCKETAALINKNLNLPIIYDARLRERTFGKIEGSKWDDFSEDLKEKDKYQTYDYREYGGESAKDVENRVFEFIKELQRNYRKEKIIVVTHAGVIRLLHHLLIGKIPEKIHNASIHEFEFPDEQ